MKTGQQKKEIRTDHTNYLGLNFSQIGAFTLGLMFTSSGLVLLLMLVIENL